MVLVNLRIDSMARFVAAQHPIDSRSSRTSGR